jgi:predicted amidohydrolase
MMRYKALALQTTCYAINSCANPEASREKMLQNIERISNQIRASKAFIGNDLKLVVLPEYTVSGFPMGESIAQWKAKACISEGDHIYLAFSNMAKNNGIYLSFNAYEIDPHFPEMYFQSSFIFDPEGSKILTYRRLNSMYAPTPHDVLQKYLEIYGYEGLFPVVRTPIGNLACIASEEILYPEIARCLMTFGAEIFLHASSEVGSNLLTQKNVAKLARAIENMAYVVSANSAGIADTSIPMSSTDGASKIIQYEGIILSEAGYGESMVANATIDLAALRAHRHRPGMSNFIGRQRFELYAPSYQKTFYPADNWPENTPDRSHFSKTQETTIQQLLFNKIIEPTP